MNKNHKPLINCRHIHFIGIGGIGMSGLAELMLRYGYQVSGSDIRQTPILERLSDLGVTIFQNQKPGNIVGADLIVYSSAIPLDNPERLEACQKGLLTVTRADLLGTLSRNFYAIAVSGSHGKTSTSAMIIKILTETGLDPSGVIGGIMKETCSNVRFVKGKWMVVEADEYDRSFHTLAPMATVITSIDADHMEYYGSQNAIDEAFVTFSNFIPVDSPLIVCGDDKGISRISSSLRRRLITYGLAPKANISAQNVVQQGWNISADVVIRGVPSGHLILPQPGECNLLNALAAIGIADYLKIPIEQTLLALGQYRGLRRRFELLGKIRDITILDDYAHHPVEIEASLQAVSNSNFQRIFVIFQPHLYSRTKYFARDFGRVFGQAPIYRTLVTKVYPARERDMKEISGNIIVEASKEFGSSVEFIEEKERAIFSILEDLKAGDLVLTLGAGDVDGIGRQILKLLQDRGV